MRNRIRTAVPALALVLWLAACGSGDAAHGGPSHLAAAGLRLVRLSGFNTPIGIAGAPSDASRVFVLQREGQVMLLLNGHRQAKPFLDLSSTVHTDGNEEGLIGIALPSDYNRSGLFYVDYTVSSGDIEIKQYQRSATDPNVADPASGRTVLEIPHHEFPNHNGGQMAFGPEGDLYIGVGDGGSEGDPNGNGQNTDTLLAKILRIHPSPSGGYTIPHSNPFVGVAGKREEIWAYGLRNPWRFSFDRSTGDLIVGDVGQDQEEEIDFIPAGTGAGANFGWSVWEGDRRNKPGIAPHARFPSIVAKHSDGYCAIIGGFVVRDHSLGSLYGRYLYGDFCHGELESVKFHGTHASAPRATGLSVSETSSFGQDARGRIYVASVSGSVYRISAAH